MTNIKYPYISIVIPVYNRASAVSRTLDAFIAQDYPYWECLLIDDHSTDNTKDVLNQYAEKDSRFRVLSNSRRKGAQGARNTGILAAKYEWISIFDSDDYPYANYLSALVKKINNNVDIITSYLNIIFVGRNMQNITKWGGNGNLHVAILKGSTYVAFNMAIIRKQSLLDIGLLDEECPAFQEWDTHIRLSEHCSYALVPQCLSDYYCGMPDSITAATARNIKGQCYILNKHRFNWRKLAYCAFLKKANELYAIADKQDKRMLVQIAPELLLYRPLKLFKKALLK